MELEYKMELKIRNGIVGKQYNIFFNGKGHRYVFGNTKANMSFSNFFIGKKAKLITYDKKGIDSYKEFIFKRRQIILIEYGSVYMIKGKHQDYIIIWRPNIKWI